MPLSDKQINERCDTAQPMITPFVPELLRYEHGRKVISYGCASYAYDMRVASEAVMPVQGWLDPKDTSTAEWIDARRFENIHGQGFIVPPHGIVLARSVETWHIPDDVYVIVLGKSTYARQGLIINCTPMEPGWKGVLVIELQNPTQLPIYVYEYEGIAAAIFFQSEPCSTTYADRGGKYMNQSGIVHSKV